MLCIPGQSYRPCDGIPRRDFLRVGALGVGGLTLADMLRLKACRASTNETGFKAVIMVFLDGGPPHLDMYDLKPDAPAEIRGEFRPIKTNVPGMEICELMPWQARIADKLAIVRNMRFLLAGHAGTELVTTFPDGGKPQRPAFGAVVSRLRGGSAHSMPPYVSLVGRTRSDTGDPSYLGPAHRPFVPDGEMNLGLPRGVTWKQLEDRQLLLGRFDTLRRDLDSRGEMAGMEAFTAKALDMIVSPQVRRAFDVAREPPRIADRYGPATPLLLARRLVEAGVSIVSVSLSTVLPPRGDWDYHGGNRPDDNSFHALRARLPLYDRAMYALVTDLHERGLDKDVAVVAWGEFGRTPKINATAGRDHWPSAGFALFAGGGLKTGQMIGDTGPRGEMPRGKAYMTTNVLATLYRVLGIDPATTLPDYSGRPMYLLGDRDPIAELG
jgi:hypothetical protein